MSRATLYHGDALDVMRQLEPRTFQTIVTSPPYWGLRDYGTGEWVNADPLCDHRSVHPRGDDEKRGKTAGPRPLDTAVACRKCGGRRVDRQLGMEPKIDDYISNMVAYFHEARRLLKRDGTLWLNIGDTYTSAASGCPPPDHSGDQPYRKSDGQIIRGHQPQSKARARIRATPPGMRRKNLALIPERLLLALQLDRWYVRARIVWWKPNPMPETLTDRPTRDFEFIYLLARNRSYYYDAAAIAEPALRDDQGRVPSGWQTGAGNHHEKVGRYPATDAALERAKVSRSDLRNCRSVWIIPCEANRGDHFATFPEELARRCILAGSRPGDQVLDPFGGSGTVAAAALSLARSATYIDLRQKYVDDAYQRVGPLMCDRNLPGYPGVMVRAEGAV